MSMFSVDPGVTVAAALPFLVSREPLCPVTVTPFPFAPDAAELAA
jgi:hypothetical protein